jgi:hypothetical protein
VAIIIPADLTIVALRNGDRELPQRHFLRAAPGLVAGLIPD